VHRPIASVVEKAHHRANAILRCLVMYDARLLARAFTIYGRPILECNCDAWSTQTMQDIEDIERVQRRFTMRLSGFTNVSYVDSRLRKLELCSLELRRRYFDLCMCYLIIFGQANACMLDLVEFNDASQRSSLYKLYKRHTYRVVFELHTSLFVL